MGSKSNLLTLRQPNALNYSRLHLHEFLYNYTLLHIITYLFSKKKVFLTKSNIFLIENKIFLTLFIFFRVATLSTYNKIKKQKKIILKDNIATIFKSLKFFKKNLIIFTIINLNFFLRKKKKKIAIFFKTLKRDGLKLFPRRFKFFLDFLQISLLLLHGKLSANFVVKIFAEIFRILQKKMHAKFFIFINKYFTFLILERSSNKNATLKGLKLLINGKLKGKPRSSNFICTAGRIPIQTLCYNIDYAKADAHTIYGVFGLKLWIYR